MPRRPPAQPPAPSLRACFEAQGFVVLEPWLRPAELALLRAECDAVVAAAAAAAAQGEATLPLVSAAVSAPWEARQRGCVFELPAACGVEHARDAASFRAKRGRAACRVLFGARLRRLASTLLRPARGGAALPLTLLNEQFVVKPPHSGPAAAFGWHRDGAWCHAQAPPQPRYVSVWVPLDDVCEENGTLYILPGSHAAQPGGGPAPPAPDAGCDLAGAYVATVRAGAAVVLSDAVLHASGCNLSDTPRRAWMPQLAAAPVLRADGAPLALAVPLAPLRTRTQPLRKTKRITIGGCV